MVTCGLVQGCFDLPHQWQLLLRLKLLRGKTTRRESRVKLVKAGGERQGGREVKVKVAIRD